MVIVTKYVDLNQTHTYIELKGLVDLRLINLPRLLISDDNHISRPMINLLATFKYICLFDVWAQRFDKLKRALPSALLAWWMYSSWLRLSVLIVSVLLRVGLSYLISYFIL